MGGRRPADHCLSGARTEEAAPGTDLLAPADAGREPVIPAPGPDLGAQAHGPAQASRGANRTRWPSRPTGRSEDTPPPGTLPPAPGSPPGTTGLSHHAPGVKPGDEVIVADHTFPAHTVRYVGAVPVFADVRAATGTIDPQAVADLFARDLASPLHAERTDDQAGRVGTVLRTAVRTHTASTQSPGGAA